MKNIFLFLLANFFPIICVYPGIYLRTKNCQKWK
jgi:hypothetical protein